MNPHLLSLDNTERIAAFLTGIALGAFAVLNALNQLWFLAVTSAITLPLWLVFVLTLKRNQRAWSNMTFYIICVAVMFSAISGVKIWWLTPTLLCALAGWDLMHLYLRLADYEETEVQKGLTPIIKQHYQRLGGVCLAGMILVIVVNLVKINVHFGWNLFLLLIAGIAIRYIVRWTKKRYD